MKPLYTIIIACLYPVITYAQLDKENLSQTIRGTIVDKTMQTPLPGATIVLLNSDPPAGTISDEDGKFRIEKVPVGRQEIKIMYLGYKETTMDVLVNSGKETVLTVSMEEEIKQLDEITVTSNRRKNVANNPLIVNSVINLRTDEINKFAGSRQDPSRMASNYAGVAGGGDQRNDIIVRGNSPIGVLWRLEGVDIPNPNHFTFTGNSGGAFSILNNNLLANSDFLTGAFPAEYGNKTAAVFDVKLRNGNNEKRENTVQVGLNGLEYATEGPLSKKNGSSYLASYRYLSFGVLNKLGVSIGANGIPQYQDLAFKLNLPTKKSGVFTVWALGGKSSIKLKDIQDTSGTEKTNPVVISETEFASDMYAAGISHTHLINEKTTGKLIVSGSGSRIKVLSTDTYKNESVINDYTHRNNEGQVILNYTLTHKFNARHLVKTGINYRTIFYKISEEYYSDEDSAFRTGLNQKGKAGLLQTFIHWNFHLTDRLSINTGLYYQLFALNKSYSIEPRFSANYFLGEKQRLTFSAGLHSQTHSLFIYQYQFYQKSTDSYTQPNKNLGMLKSLHVVGGYNRSITSNLKFKAEAYYQHMYNVPVSIASFSGANVYSILNTGADYGFYTADSTVNKGTGKNYGAEFTLERRFKKDYYFLSTLSILNSKFKGSDGIERNTAFNIGHVINLLAGKEFHLDQQNRKVLSVDMKITHSGGRRIIGVDKDKSISEGKAVYDFAHAYEIKLKDYFRTDLKISYNINREKATHNFFIAADNLLNTRNVLTQDWDNNKKEVVTYYQLGIFPYLGYRVQF